MIVIKRNSGYADKFRKYKVFIDDKIVGTIADGEEKEFSLDAGSHKIYCKYGFYKTSLLTVEDGRVDSIRLSCINNLRVAKVHLALFYAFLWPVNGSYIELSPE